MLMGGSLLFVTWITSRNAPTPGGTESSAGNHEGDILFNKLGYPFTEKSIRIFLNVKTMIHRRDNRKGSDDFAPW